MTRGVPETKRKRPKNAGTAAETAFVRFLIKNGWPYAERRSLSGRFDKGDTTGHPGLCFEVKAAANPAFPNFMRQTEVEKVNAGADFGMLVHKPKGVGLNSVDTWTAMMIGDEFDKLLVQAGVEHEVDWTLARFIKLDVRAALKTSDIANQLSRQKRFYVVRISNNKNTPDFVALYLSDLVDLLHLAGYGEKNQGE